MTLLLSCKPLGQTGLLSTTWSAPETFLSTCTLEKMHGAETRGRSLKRRILINVARSQNKGSAPYPLRYRHTKPASGSGIHSALRRCSRRRGIKAASLPGLSCSRTELCTNSEAAHWPLLSFSVNRKPGLVCEYGLHCHLCEPMPQDLSGVKQEPKAS